MSLSDLLAETPANASRIPIFAPTRRPTAVERWRVDTGWGWAIITGRLGQLHRDVIDGASAVAERRQRTPDGRLHLLIDPARLRALLGWDRINYSQLDRTWCDLRSAEVELEVTARGIRVQGKVVEDVITSSAAGTRRAGTFARASVELQRVSLGQAWSTLLEDDLQTRYPLREVARLRYGISQAMARYCWTHRAVDEPLAGVVKRLGGQRALRKLRVELGEESNALAALGVVVSGDRVTWRERRQAGRKTPVPTDARTQNPGSRTQNPGSRTQNPGETGAPQLIS